MRSLLFVGPITLVLGLSGIGAFAAPTREMAPAANVEMISLAQALAPDRNRPRASVFDARADQGAKAGESFAAAAGTIGVLAGVGLIGTLAAVGLRRIWVKSPLRDPYLEGPA